MSDAQKQADKAVLERMFEGFNRHDADAVMACMTDDVVFETVAGSEAHGTRIEGRDAVRAAFEGVWTAMPDARWEVSRHTAAGDLGVSEWTFSGTDKEGRRTEAQGCDLFAFRDGKAAHKRAFRKQRPTFQA
ncbi:MAG: nuclear transport factor 2 family protein [Geminicoccaceae bacterium]|nr:nuclear transport factor 2 family protein [Geminicoccaceae bacterium]